MPRKSDPFKPGDLVFAKMKGYPHWPARVCKSENGYKKRVPVYFFGTHQIGHLPPKNIVPYAGNKMKYGSGVRIKGFSEGMWEIQNTPGIGSKLKVLPPPPRVKSACKATLAKVTPVSKATSDKQVTNDKPKTVGTAAQSAPPKSDSKVAASRTASDEKETEAVVKTRTRVARPAPEKTTRSRKTRKQVTATDAAEPAVGTRSRTTAASSGPPTTNTTALDSKEEVGTKQRRKRQAASPAVTTAVSKKLKPMESNSLKQKPENKQEKDQEEEKKSLESQGVKSNREERDDKTVQEKPNQDCSEGEKEVVEKDKMESKSKGRKRKKGKDLNSEEEKQSKSNHFEALEKAKVTTKEKVEEKKPAEIYGMAEKENQKEKTEIKQDVSKRGTRRQKRLLGKGRKRLMRKGADLKTKDINEENKEVTLKTKVQKEGMLEKTGEKAMDEGMNLRKDGKEKKQTKDTGDNPEPEMMAREDGQGIKKKRKKNKLQQEEIEGEREESEGKTTNMRENDKGEEKMNKRGGNEDNKKEERVKKMERKGEKESCSVNEERQQRLAANRESLLKSLRGLLKAGRGRNRREAVKNTQKTGDGGRKKTEFKKMRSQKTADKNTVNESSIIKRSSINMKKEDKKESRMVRSMTNTSQIESTRKGKDEKEKGVKGNEQKTDKTTAVEVRIEEKESRLKKKETNAERKKDEDGKEKRVVEMQNEETNQQKDEKKNDNKIIGKIVKATAGTGAKVQLKAIMARIPAAVEDEKREKNVEEKLDSNKMEANKKTSEKINEKNKRGSTEEKKSEDKKTDTNVGKSERKGALTEDTKDKNTTDTKKNRKNVVGEEKQNVGGKGKKTLEKNRVEQKATINEQEKRKEAEVEKIMTREQKKREGKSDRRSQKVDKVAAEPSKKVSTQLEKESAGETKPLKSSVEEQRTTTEGAEAEQASKTKGKEKVGKNTTKEERKTKSDSSDEGNVKQAQDKNLTMTDSTLHRIHGDIRISLKNDNPDIGKCVAALDQLSMVSVTSKLIQRHSELVVTLRKLRYYRASQDVMDKASMLYNRFKNTFLVGEGEEMVSATFLRSLLEEKEREEAQRVEHCKERLVREELLQEVKRRMGQVKERRANGGGDEEADRAKRKEKTT